MGETGKMLWNALLCRMGINRRFLARSEASPTASFSQLAMASLVFYPRYLDLRSGGICEIERAIDYLAELKQTF